MKKDNISLVVSVVGVIIACVALFTIHPLGSKSFGAAGNLLAENYDSYIMANGGFNTALPIKTASTLNVADTATFTGAAVFSGAVTGIATSSLTTLAVSATTTLTGQLNANNVLNTFGNAVTSTIKVGAASKSGCIELGDSANGANIVYITATGATVSATTTKPSACQ